MNPFFWVDERLITHVAEPIAWRTQYHWGKDNFDLARWSTHVAASAFFLFTALSYIETGDYRFVLITALVAWKIFWKDEITSIDKIAQRVRSSPTALNFAKTEPAQLMRIVLYWFGYPAVTTSISMLSKNPTVWIFAALFVASELCTAYLTACNPMPPRW